MPFAKRVVPLAPDGLSLARRKRGKKIVKTGETRIFPVELLVGALQIAEFTEQAKFRLGGKSHVHAGCPGKLAQFH